MLIVLWLHLVSCLALFSTESVVPAPLYCSVSVYAFSLVIIHRWLFFGLPSSRLEHLVKRTRPVYVIIMVFPFHYVSRHQNPHCHCLHYRSLRERCLTFVVSLKSPLFPWWVLFISLAILFLLLQLRPFDFRWVCIHSEISQILDRWCLSWHEMSTARRQTDLFSKLYSISSCCRRAHIYCSSDNYSQALRIPSCSLTCFHPLLHLRFSLALSAGSVLTSSIASKESCALRNFPCTVWYWMANHLRYFIIAVKMVRWVVHLHHNVKLDISTTTNGAA